MPIRAIGHKAIYGICNGLDIAYTVMYEKYLSSPSQLEAHGIANHDFIKSVKLRGNGLPVWRRRGNDAEIARP